ncbi:MAG: hypothetical protein COW73_04465 [Nitrospirae bacterium CG18_big_fil_WC_8_21_14_2_50_70_55]|nr:response regulator [Deltaproteobacteria bacterium]OIP62053.1 MAG: hypothetical protein AUK30_10805 [Nitrospirae bacterium CG2_30_70_394]PIQ05840.1 MAG: hypothetical protein COW73_04465 [Nitrospirae bacterium CG18_big_fil_WC_8_21_14_2_50_70_55]PIU79619.1 MAG: hypothetical protein COS73_03590 [Nitrospirae bacterium CG06_land_8_20_14_3_00_70_43]PIW82925.1 MAG: hypothetical protein COZ96_06175 [Nitrospirae bacterium CG_4_8_14_3_um_filter_70_85]PIX83812.1 MAG: hypothetical protein COZ33_03435 [N
MSRGRILLVDDEASIRSTLSLILSREGYEVVTAADLASGTAQCGTQEWDVVLTDMILPDGSGIELMRCMHERGSQVPVIAITGEPNLDTAVEAVRLGAYDYVSKPLRRETLVRVVERALERYRLSRENARYRHDLERLVEARTGELIASERRYRELIEGAPEMIHQLDEAGRFLAVNRTQLSTLGYTLDELLQQPLASICAEDQAEQVADHLRRIRETGRSELATQFRRRDGTLLDVEIRALAVRDEDSSFLLSRGFAHDTTGRKRLEMQLIQADKLSTIGLMVSGVAHDVNNPLTGIAGYAEMLLAQGSLAPEVESSLRFIYGEAERAGRIVANLLGFVRQEEGRRDYFDLHTTIDAVVDLMAYRLRQARVEVRRTLDRNLGAVYGDKHQIQQVLLNLVNNAVQAMAGGDGAACLSLATRVVEGEVAITVADTGRGIPPSILGSIFDPFFTTKREGEGTGLGLSITRAAVEAHGGRLQVESVVGKGTTFTVWLPLPMGDEEVEVRNEPAGEAVAEALVSVGPVLVIDDELHIRTWLQRILQGFGYPVEVAVNGADGLARIAARDFSVVLLDYMLPDTTGIRVYEALASTHAELQSRVVFMTGAIDRVVEQYVRDHRLPFLQKPFNAKALRGVLTAVAR